MRRALARTHAKHEENAEGQDDDADTESYRDLIAAKGLAHACASGDISLVLYDVTTPYFEAAKEDDLRKVGFSKEWRVDPQTRFVKTSNGTKSLDEASLAKARRLVELKGYVSNIPPP